jgi:hypothetical protein
LLLIDRVTSVPALGIDHFQRIVDHLGTPIGGGRLLAVQRLCQGARQGNRDYERTTGWYN